MKTMDCYLKITHASDAILEPEYECIIYGSIAQYHLLKELAIAYTSAEKHMAFVGFVGRKPEKAYFGGREVLVVIENDIVNYYAVKNGKLQKIHHCTFAYYVEDEK